MQNRPDAAAEATHSSTETRFSFSGFNMERGETGRRRGYGELGNEIQTSSPVKGLEPRFSHREEHSPTAATWPALEELQMANIDQLVDLTVSSTSCC